MPGPKLKVISIVPQFSYPGRGMGVRMWEIRPELGIVPVFTPYTFLHVGHSMNDLPALLIRASRHALW